MGEIIKPGERNDDGEPEIDYSVLENIEDFGERREVIINGATVRHTGSYEGYLYENAINGNPHTESVEAVEMFDSAGNRFITNCKKEEAEELIKKYGNDKYEAITGPKAPERLPNGRFVPSRLGDDYIGIFVRKRES